MSYMILVHPVHVIEKRGIKRTTRLISHADVKIRGRRHLSISVERTVPPCSGPIIGSCPFTVGIRNSCRKKGEKKNGAKGRDSTISYSLSTGRANDRGPRRRPLRREPDRRVGCAEAKIIARLSRMRISFLNTIDRPWKRNSWRVSPRLPVCRLARADKIPARIC